MPLPVEGVSVLEYGWFCVELDRFTEKEGNAVIFELLVCTCTAFSSGSVPTTHARV